jgi:hypothetical protein
MIKKEFREIFVNDYKLPIQFLESPYFEYFLNLYNEEFEINKKVELFNNTISHFKSVEEFKNKWHVLKNQIIDDIKKTKEYQELNQSEFYRSPLKIERGHPYNQKYINVPILSIDIIQANFNCLKNHNPNILLGANSFKELVKMYTDLDYYSDIKIFRQIVFEQLNAGRQQSLQREITDSLIIDLKKEIPNIFIKMPANDEVCIPLNQNITELKDRVLNVLSKHKLKHIFRTEEFVLRHISNNFFFKDYGNGKIKLRMVPKIFYAQAYKKAKNKEIEDFDLLFVHEGKIAKFQETL